MSFNIDNFGSDASNVKSILGGVCYYRYYNKDNNTVTTPGYFPASLGLQLGDRITVIPQTKTDADEKYIVSDITNRVVTVTQVDTDGVVDSVNGKTGHVVLDATDVGALPSSTQIPDAVQYAIMPTASADNEGQIVQFTGTTDATYTNGYFYKCTGAGEPVVYSWTQVSVQPAPSGLPDQTGQSGKFLTTDGTDASWATISALQNTATGSNALTILGTATNNADAINIGVGSVAKSSGDISIGKNCSVSGGMEQGIGIGSGVISNASKSIVIGADAQVINAGSNAAIVIGKSAKTTGASAYGIAIGFGATVSASNAIQLGRINATTAATNSDANTFKVANANGNFELMNANGNIPAARIASITGLADGNYRLRLTISGGVPTLSWVAE